MGEDRSKEYWQTSLANLFGWEEEREEGVIEKGPFADLRGPGQISSP
jgi:hypothetical protein